MNQFDELVGVRVAMWRVDTLELLEQSMIRLRCEFEERERNGVEWLGLTHFLDLAHG